MPAMDFAYLESFLAHDRKVIGEVLAIFAEQAEAWDPALAHPGPDWRDLAHTIKGAARGVGANELADASAVAEAGEVSDLAAVRAALGRTAAEISAYRAEAA